jgi:hypothetical protein
MGAHSTPRAKIPMPAPWGDEWAAHARAAGLPLGQWLLRRLIDGAPPVAGELSISGELYAYEAHGRRVLVDLDGRPVPLPEQVAAQLGARGARLWSREMGYAVYEVEW